MGQRSRSESVVAVFQAFLEKRTWLQAELGRKVGIQTAALRLLLNELMTAGMPLDRDEESANEIYWSVPNDWYPGGAFFSGGELLVLLRQLACLPASSERDQLMDASARCLNDDQDLPSAFKSIVIAPKSDRSEACFGVLVEAARTKQAVDMRYYSQSKGRESRRHVSVHRVISDQPQQILATCHRSGEIRRFRVDGVLEASIDAGEPFRDATKEAVDARQAASVGGFHGVGPTRPVRFFVPYPDARWIAKNLPNGMSAVESDDGIHVTAHTAAVLQVARFVVGLGGLARPETPELAQAVAELARQALAACDGVIVR